MKLTAIASIFALSLFSGAASAAGGGLPTPANFSFSGVFAHDNDVQLFNFTVGAASLVELRSWSYAGGVNAAGQNIARGGFDPILALFDSNGVKIGEQDDAGCGASGVAADAVTRSCWDTRFAVNLSAGTYTASIQQYNNFARATLAQGFAFDGVQNQNFRNGFYDANTNQRTSSWAFDILNVSAANIPNPVPEPASMALLGLGLVGVAAVRRRRKAA